MLNGYRFDSACNVVSWRATDEAAFEEERQAVEQHLRKEKPYYHIHDGQNGIRRKQDLIKPVAVGIVSPESDHELSGYVFSKNKDASKNNDLDYYDYIWLTYQPAGTQENTGTMKTEHYKAKATKTDVTSVSRKSSEDNLQLYEQLFNSLLYKGEGDYLAPYREAYDLDIPDKAKV